MTLSAIIAIACAVIGALFGGALIHPISKSSGRKEGEQQAQQQQEIIQAQEAVKAVQERAHVEAEVAADTDDELDARLSRHNRAG